MGASLEEPCMTADVEGWVELELAVAVTKAWAVESESSLVALPLSLQPLSKVTANPQHQWQGG